MRENEELVQQVLARLESKNPNYAPLLKYKAEMARSESSKERLAEGKGAPNFHFLLLMERKIRTAGF